MESEQADKAAREAEDIYAAQRDELIALLKDCLSKNEPLRVHEKKVLSQDDIPALLQKIKNNLPFSRREREALAEAGFAVPQLYPDLV
jgi:hypothetical protein